MERRHSKRIDVQVDVKISFDSKSYDGFIDYVSREGVRINIITTSEEMVISFVPGTILKLKFQTETKDEITLQCEIKWVNLSSERHVGFIYILGAKIIDPPAEYKKFVLTL